VGLAGARGWCMAGYSSEAVTRQWRLIGTAGCGWGLMLCFIWARFLLCRSESWTRNWAGQLPSAKLCTHGKLPGKRSRPECVRESVTCKGASLLPDPCIPMLIVLLLLLLPPQGGVSVWS
jgi:hypothetical protein